jgi:hypothetical protein
MREAVLMLYGEYENDRGIVHPWEEDMFREPHELQQQFREQGIDFHVGIALDRPAGFRELGNVPSIAVAEQPVYDGRGVLQKTTEFKEASLEDYPTVIDHWVANFQDRVVQPDGSRQRTAYGLGIPNERLWNCRPIQNFGNHKGLMDAVLQRSGVGLPTYATSELDKLTSEYPDKGIIFKPIDGSRGKGIEVFDRPIDFQKALRLGEIAQSGLIQPFLDLRSPMPDLRAANDAAKIVLSRVNAANDRTREIRVHVLARTNDSGATEVVAHPTLKYGYPGEKVLSGAYYASLDPESAPYMRETSKHLARDVIADAAIHSGESVTQYYGVFDWVVDTEGQPFVVDGNCRGPALPAEAIAARQSFTRILAENARQNMHGFGASSA